ncbi:ABC transporter ATP-binding protein [Kribbella sp. DT2]|uniref:ABC transporter ATP-binding protein n=1 Tax=Kribbella sp. DT2 TaxID=3393427 RepID=UPI003CE6A521
MSGSPQPAAHKVRFRITALRVVATLGVDRARLVAVVVLAVTGVGLTVVVPTLLGQATDLGVKGIRGDGVDHAALRRLLLIAAGLTVCSWLLQIAQGRLIAAVVQAMAGRLRVGIEAKIFRLPVSYFDLRPRGEVLSRATSDIDNLANTLQRVFARVLGSSLLIVGTLAMMLRISPVLAGIVLATAPLTVLTARGIGKQAQPAFAKQWAVAGKLAGHVEETYSGHDLIAAFGRQDQAARVLGSSNDELRDASVRSQFVSGLTAPVTAFIGNATYVLVAVIGALQVAAGTLTIGGIQAFVQYVLNFNQPVTTLASLAGQIQSAVTSAERVFDLQDVEEEPAGTSAGRPAVIAEGRVVFDRVSFRYRADVPVIEDLSLTVEPGRMVAIVGPTGGGKTTLINLLLRFYEVDAGTISIDGTGITAMTRQSLRRHIGMVPQDTWLASGTIAENIAYGRPDASREEVVDAALAAHAHHLIRTLPDGYETRLDAESGLSAGERQLISIARAFLVRPPILVLDEATSAVDTRTEMLIQQATTSLLRDRTSFVVAHRLSTVRNAELILVMERGRIVEQGRHQDLVRANGTYARLYEAQFARVADLQRSGEAEPGDR